ncbi:hypothetical protein E2562_017978 [Oryza meyeriana var. granulata]|uniref:NAC domain-containing protein n=1 Tax=Oryza meyeriana var. granulata TaxID=110450 RepID=A0A6G1F8V0_9ORYZ|nr:hypothetical protein E2562_017978 [Oryza meyeriana var. granulata]
MAAPEDGEDKKLPQGFRYMPEDLELLDILEVKLSRRPLHRAYDAVFHDIRILDFHPAKLYERYAKDEENGYIYFFSTREFPRYSKKRPLRDAEGGSWRSTGVNKAVKSKKSGGLDVGQKQTLVFYQRFPGDKEAVKTNWGLHEFTRIIGPQNKVSDLAVYRLYKIRKNDKETPEDLAAEAAARRNKRSCTERGQASAAMALPPPAPGMAAQANVVSTSQAYAPLQSSTYAAYRAAAPRPGSSLAPPRAPVPINSWATPSAPAGPSSRALPIAPGHPGHFEPIDSRRRLYQQPPIAASPVDRKGKAPPHSTVHGGNVGSTSAPASRAANYQPPPLRATEHTVGVRIVGEDEDDDWQRELVAMMLAEDSEESSGAQMDATTPPSLEDDNDDGSAAGGAGEGGSQPHGG